MNNYMKHVENILINFKKKIDEHFNYIEEFCQKTMINKKGTQNQTSYKKKAGNSKRK
jgi:hypothetical protein